MPEVYFEDRAEDHLRGKVSGMAYQGCWCQKTVATRHSGATLGSRVRLLSCFFFYFFPVLLIIEYVIFVTK